MVKLDLIKYFMDFKSKVTDKNLIKLFYFILFLNLIDGIITLIGISNFYMYEKNPFLFFLITKVGILNAIFIKIIVVSLLLLFCINTIIKIKNKNYFTIYVCYLFVAGIILYAIANNIIKLLLFVYP